MYWNARQFPELADRPPAERMKIVKSAIEQQGGAYRIRLPAVWLAAGAGIIAFNRWFAPGAAFDDWHRWVAVVVGGLLLYAYFLWEINGSIHGAVRKYVAARKS